MFGHTMKSEWALDPAITYLNHGTVGAPPRRVLEAQQKLRDEIERQPSQFLLRELSGVRIGFEYADRPKPRLRVAADAVAAFFGTTGDELVFVDNATSGVNAALSSVPFREGDELLLLDSAYGAVRNAAEYWTRAHGAQVRVVGLPLTLTSPEHAVDIIEAALGPRTRVLLLDHIISDLAIVLPVAEIANRCQARGIAVLVDGAHAPGAIPVNIEALGVDWYTGNLHKWAWSPRSSAILWTKPAHRDALHHPIVSWGINQGLAMEFDSPGTRDPTPHLAAPAGLAFMQELGVEAVQSYNHELICNARREMLRHWKADAFCPETMLGTMAALRLPEHAGNTEEEAARLRDKLLFEDQIEVHIKAWKGRILLRVSAQIYNEMQDVTRLVDAIDRRIGLA